jgi:hypothetical protein
LVSNARRLKSASPPTLGRRRRHGPRRHSRPPPSLPHGRSGSPFTCGVCVTHLFQIIPFPLDLAKESVTLIVEPSGSPGPPGKTGGSGKRNER